MILWLGTYDYNTIHGIVNATNVLHVSFVPDTDDQYPIILPMIGQMGLFSQPELTDLNQCLDLYLHGSISARISNLCQEAVDRGEDGLRLCLAATKVDGLVLAHTPFHHSYNFRSAVLHGYAQVVDDPDEKLYALRLITNKVVPTRWENTRTPPNEIEMQSTHILRVTVQSGSAKLRSGTPNADRKDLQHPEVLRKFWSGVVPVFETFGAPISGPLNKADIPQHVTDFVKESNTRNQRNAAQASEVRDTK